MLFESRRGRERLNGDGSASSKLRDRLHAQANKSSKFSRSSGVWSRPEKKCFKKILLHSPQPVLPDSSCMTQ